MSNGEALIQSSVSDNGQGSATIMRQIAADTLGNDVKLVHMEWADSQFPLWLLH